MEQDTQIIAPAAVRAARPPREAGQAPGNLLLRAFFEAAPDHVAPRLLGKLLAHRTAFGWIAGRIVEVEAYLGPHQHPSDPAAHAHNGPTPRNRVLFGPAGHAYVYSIYGLYSCMNISCEKPDRAGCVLLRALSPTTGYSRMARNRGLLPSVPPRELTGGPGRLCQALGLKRSAHNGLDLLDPASPFQLLDDGFHVNRVLVTHRIGIRHAVDLPLRFAVPGDPCVSGPKSLAGEYLILPAPPSAMAY